MIFNGKLSEEADRFLTESNTEFNEKQNQLREKYLSDQVRYDIDFEKGTLVIVRPESRVTFGMKLLGSCRNRDNSWEWAWNNPNIDRKIAFPRSELAPLASKHQLHHLDAGAVVLPDEKFPWYLGGIALKVSPSASGIYSASSAGHALLPCAVPPHRAATPIKHSTQDMKQQAGHLTAGMALPKAHAGNTDSRTA